MTTEESQRYHILHMQFQLDEPYSMLVNRKESLERIFHYIYKYTNISFIDFIDENTLISYMKFYKKGGFKENSFTQTIKDIKVFQHFQKHIRKANTLTDIDLSIKNYLLWIRI